jgi:hypothetical protein
LLSNIIQPLTGIFTVCLFTFSTSACEKKQEGNFTISYQIPEGQDSLGESIIEIKVKDVKTGEAVEDARIQIEGNMSHPGMAPVFAKVLEIGDGVYKAQINFNMAGDWILTANVLAKDGRRGDGSFKLRL